MNRRWPTTRTASRCSGPSRDDAAQQEVRRSDVAAEVVEGVTRCRLREAVAADERFVPPARPWPLNGPDNCPMGTVSVRKLYRLTHKIKMVNCAGRKMIISARRVVDPRRLASPDRQTPRPSGVR